ncbi:hypothetical protein D3C87_1173320 [compost metagenome]
MDPRRVSKPLFVGALALSLSGCGLYALGGLFGGDTPLSTSSSEPALRAFDLSGTVQVPENLTAQGDLATLPPLSISKPFETVATIAELDPRAPYRLLSVGPQEPEMSWTSDGLLRNGLVQLIDPSTGEVVATVRTDARGQFRTRAVAPAAGKGGFIIQALFKNAQGQTVGILAAPLGAQVLSVETKRKGVDVTGGSTLLTFSSMLMSESFNDITLSQGFAGIKSVRLSRLLRELDNDETGKASRVLDRGVPVIEAPNFDILLGNLATSSAVLTYEVKKASQQASGGAIGSNEAEVSLHAAVMNQMLSNLFKLGQQASASTNLFQDAASSLDLDAIKKKADAIQKAIPPDSVPPLPPAPTPTPGNIGIEFQ